MVLGYLLNRAIIVKITPPPLPLLFAASILLGQDFLFYPLFPHHTITHSVTFWSIVYAPVFALKRLAALPYLMATFSHFIVGDVITGNPPLLFGLSDVRFGILRPWLIEDFGISYGILYQSIADAAMVALFLVIAYRMHEIQPISSWAYDIKHMLILLFVVFYVFMGAFGSDLITVLEQKNDVLYLAYSIVAISHLIFIIVLVKGTIRLKGIAQSFFLGKRQDV